MKKKVNRMIRYGIACTGILFAIFIGGGFFIFGADFLSSDSDSNFLEGDAYSGNREVSLNDVDMEVVGEAEIVFNQRENSGGGGGGSGSESTTFICTRSQALQYSLRSFVNDFECLEGENSSCIRFDAECSSELYNLDYEAGGNFNVRYSLAYEEDVLDYNIDGGVVRSRAAERFGGEFELEGEFELSKLECLVDMESVGEKCLEGYWS